ncbi:hypothetical protein [Aliiroseovarius lamellibrachiae]|uniref:hypothetical protein n=1 Tax=Aliiroseovarius lamellibrachiae TaxID=1924933 RepID=UPI001BDF9F97|nr:hypothetical protein [Aliiroseovarius lamellibrachiae]MBT2131240.1 hypothetical protein [Aliiroseovarius lamellibrachiae]
MSKKRATVQYRYVNTDGLWKEFHLKDMVVDILRRATPTGSNKYFEDVSLRKIDLDQDGSFVVLNKLSEEASWDGPLICGQLIHVKAGTNLPGIDGNLDQPIPELSLQNFNIGESKQLVEGVLYFAIGQNHVGIIEGQRTRARTLERYLTRLLQDAEEMEPGKHILLNAKLEGKVRSVKALEVSPRRIQKHSTSEASDPTVSSTAGSAESEGSTVFDVLQLLGWSQEDLMKLEDSVPDDGWIEGMFKVAFKRKGRKSTSVDRKILETALRNVDANSIGLLGEGAKERGGTIKLSKVCNIPTEGELLNPSEAMKAIVENLRTWSTSGRIDYNFEP